MATEIVRCKSENTGLEMFFLCVVSLPPIFASMGLFVVCVLSDRFYYLSIITNVATNTRAQTQTIQFLSKISSSRFLLQEFELFQDVLNLL